VDGWVAARRIRRLLGQGRKEDWGESSLHICSKNWVSQSEERLFFQISLYSEPQNYISKKKVQQKGAFFERIAISNLRI
jgi:hypothetical protein